MSQAATGFLTRLKQRKLVQWALVYVAFAFAVIQVLDVVAQRFGWPGQVEKILILELAIGFLVALVLAWYHGERGAQRVSGTEIVILALILVIDAAQQRPPGRNHDIAMARALQIGPNRVVADAALQSLIAKHAGDSSYQIAEAYTLRRDPDNMFKWLDQAWANRDSVTQYLTYDP